MVDFNQMKSFGQDPLILERGEGIRVTDVFGKTYIDGLSGVFTVNLGHGIAEFADIAAEQMRQISFTAPTMATNPPALRLADLLISITPPQYTTVKFFTGGSEANEAAIKLARQYHAQTGHPRKYKVISRYKSYHGGTGHAMAASAQVGLEVEVRAVRARLPPRHAADPARLRRLPVARRLHAGLRRR